MARARNIKPDFFTDEDIVELQPLTRLMFIGMWTLADRRGRMEDRPKQIKLRLLPVDDHDVDFALNELQQHNFIQRYKIDGKSFIQISNFSKHQSPHKDEKESVIPPPPEVSQEETPDKHGASMVQTPDKHGSLRPDCLNLIADSFNLNPDSQSPPVKIAKGEDPTPARMTLFEIRSAFREHTGTEPNGSINNELSEFCKDFTREAIIDALMLTGTRVPRPTNPFSYFRTTLQGRSHNKESPGEEFDPAKDYPEGSFYAAMKEDHLKNEARQ